MKHCQLPQCKKYISGANRKYCKEHLDSYGNLKTFAKKLLGKKTNYHKPVPIEVKFPFQCMEFVKNSVGIDCQCDYRFTSEEWRNVHMIKEHGHYVTGCSRMNPQLEAKKDFTKHYIRKINTYINSKLNAQKKCQNKIGLCQRQIEALDTLNGYVLNTKKLAELKNDINHYKFIIERHQAIIIPYKARMNFLCNHAVEIGAHSIDYIFKYYKIVYDKKSYDNIMESQYKQSDCLGDEIRNRVL